MVDEIVQILSSLDEEQLTYIYTYIKEYFGADAEKIAEALK